MRIWGVGEGILGGRSGCGGAMPTLALREKPVYVHGAVWKMAGWKESLALPRNSSKTSQYLPSALSIALDTTSQQSFS